MPMIRLSIDQRFGRKGNRLLVLLSLLYVLLCLGGAIGLAFSARGEFSVERAPVVALFMSAAMLILFFVPLWGIDRGMPWKRVGPTATGFRQIFPGTHSRSGLYPCGPPWFFAPFPVRWR